MTAALPRTTCPVCGRDVAARQDGTARHHYGTPGQRRWCTGGYRDNNNEGA